jgi:hypothetical protein
MSELLEGLDAVRFGIDIETDKVQEVYEILEYFKIENNAD